MSLFRCAVLLAVLAGCVTHGEGEGYDPDDIVISEAVGELRTNTDPNRLVVYSNNIENLIFDWKDLVHTMAEADLRPDIFLVQQMSDRAELDRVLAFMKRRLGVDYDGVLAQNNPDDERFSGEVQPRPKVTTGVVFRSRRLQVVSKDSWMPFGRGFRGQRQTCEERSNHSGYETLRVKLLDTRANKHVVVVSLRHWTWEPCSTRNIREIVEGSEGGANDHAGLGEGAALHIVAGDFNDRVTDQDGAYKCWYRQMVRGIGPGDCAQDDDFGFTDPLFESCDGERACVNRNGGIDSLFVRRSDGQPVRTSHYDAISWEQAHRASVDSTGGDGPSNVRARDGYDDVADRYSGHEARRAHICYE